MKRNSKRAQQKLERKLVKNIGEESRIMTTLNTAPSCEVSRRKLSEPGRHRRQTYWLECTLGTGLFERWRHHCLDRLCVRFACSGDLLAGTFIPYDLERYWPRIAIPGDRDNPVYTRLYTVIMRMTSEFRWADM